MPSAPNTGMGRRSRSSASLSNNTSSTSSTANNSATPTAASPADAIDTTSSSTENTSSAPLPASSSSRPSFLSRLGLPLSLPLRNRNRNVTDFHIRPEEPHRRYTAGESVRGSVILVIVKPVRITHLVVSLHGYVRVLRDPATIAKTQGATLLPQGGGSMRPRYHGNGLASLFQDEQVLSGEGRLEPGKYEFGFDLMFPEKALPSSIDFERGTISYNITAVLTRPTSITPTASCDRKVMLVENVDIGLLQAPRPRTIFLEPISKRTRRKKSMILDKAVSPTEVTEIVPEVDSSDPTSPSTGEEAREHGPSTDARSPIQSDMRSEISGESASTSVSRNDVSSLAHFGTVPSSASAKQQVVDKKTITATIELLRGGCIPGDAVTVRISVQHIKRVRSMTGVIVTLYRQGKIDSAPSEALFNEDLTMEERKLAEKDEVYPRSRTGLGGLSLSSSSSTSMFRKDLDQNTAPLIIDPTTLQTTVTVSVKLPDDSFPTIKGVPGEMISFKYLVEIVVDLGGRLANQLQGGASSRFGSYSHSTPETSPSIYGPRRGNNIADTSQLRREKGVISVSMETVVGTTDSSRGRKRSRASPASRRLQIQESDDEDYTRSDAGYDQEVPYDHRNNGQFSPTGYFPPQPNGNRHPPLILPPHPPYVPLSPSSPSQPPQTSSRDFQPVNGFSLAAPAYVPPPQIPEHDELSEKERIRQAETRLLPSAPSAPSPEAGPSNSNNNDDLYEADDTPRVPQLDDVEPVLATAPDAPSAPTEEDLAAAAAAPCSESLEDKQELEYRRLMNEASAPPIFPEDEDQRNSGPSRPRPIEAEPSAPSAPMLDDLDDFPGLGPMGAPSGSGGHGETEELPAYRR